LGRLARDHLPWTRAWAADFSSFAERFTLHDSYWIGLFLPLSEANEAVLAVEWDGHWLPEPLRTECVDDQASPPVPSWPILFLRISDLQAVQLFEYRDSYSGRAISDAESSIEDGVNVLQIVDIFGGTVRLEFRGKMEFLALRRTDGRVLDLASVNP